MIIDELRCGFVLRAESELRFLLRIEVQPEQLLIAAHPRVVDDERAVERIGRAVVGEVVVGQVGDLLGSEIHRVDIADGAA